MAQSKSIKISGNIIGILFLVTYIVIQSGCGKDQSEPDQASPKVEKQELDLIETATTGLQINLENNHAPIKDSDGNLVSPDITSIRVCPLPLDTMISLGSLNPLASAANFLKFSAFLYRAYNNGLCISALETVKYGKTKKFLFPPEKLDSIYKNGNGSIFFLFNDSLQTTRVPGPCWELPQTIHSNFQQKQTFQIEITDGHYTSYSCLTQKK
jgi:hypothetical protein